MWMLGRLAVKTLTSAFLCMVTCIKGSRQGITRKAHRRKEKHTETHKPHKKTLKTQERHRNQQAHSEEGMAHAQAPAQFEREEVREKLRRLPGGPSQPLTVHLRQEIDRINTVISLTTATLRNLRLAVAGARACAGTCQNSCWIHVWIETQAYSFCPRPFGTDKEAPSRASLMHCPDDDEDDLKGASLILWSSPNLTAAVQETLHSHPWTELLGESASGNSADVVDLLDNTNRQHLHCCCLADFSGKSVLG